MQIKITKFSNIFMAISGFFLTGQIAFCQTAETPPLSPTNSTQPKQGLQRAKVTIGRGFTTSKKSPVSPNSSNQKILQRSSTESTLHHSGSSSTLYPGKN